ncbi:alpha/beta fold hydrolase [Streptomyces sp. NPDC005648]|uniref:S9 family peptidase n=1 Tax=Streptomyces sp. NPDC005648 TaxID=3157044 RepID=UPI0033BEE8F9
MTQSAPASGDWRERFAGGRLHLPRYARHAPHRCVLLTTVDGKPEVEAWDQRTGSRRQVTDQPGGTGRYAIDPAGRWVWWFADPERTGRGQWRREPFSGGGRTPVGPHGRPAGLALGTHEFALGIHHGGTTSVAFHSRRPGHERETAADFEGDRQVEQLSADGTLLAVTDVGPLGPLRPDLRVLDTATGEVLAELPARGDAVPRPLGFAPDPGDGRLLVLSEEDGAHRLLLWNPRTGAPSEVRHGLSGDLRAEWLADGSGALLCHSWHGRDTLHTLRFDTGTLERVPHDPGEIRDATARPDGDVEYLWSSAQQPPRVLSTHRGRLYGGTGRPPGAAVEDLWTEGPGGPVHTLLSSPAPGSAPVPTLFLLHGGPAAHERDAYDPYVSAWVAHGYRVARVNYRGSTGYGRAWRDAARGDVGHTELADIAAVRARLAGLGLLDEKRTLIGGSSWGGYLALLALGVQPDHWAAGFAVAPVADFALAYEEETDRLRALDRTLFGGSPQEVPDRYLRASARTYAPSVRAPVLLISGTRDPRCPPAQIEAYAGDLRDAGGHLEHHRYDGGHEERRLADLLDRITTQIDFALRHCPAGPV